jgi:hypothetical protein
VVVAARIDPEGSHAMTTGRGTTLAPLVIAEEPIGVPLPRESRRELSRRRAVVLAVALPVLALALIAGYLTAWLGWLPASAAPASGLPTRVVDPPGLTADVRRAPLASALVMFNAPSSEDPDSHPLVLVGAGDAYRTFGRGDLTAAAVLSPDGRSVLVPDYVNADKQRTRLLELSSGTARAIGPGVPLAWSPNGRYAVLAEYHGDTLHAVNVLDVVTGTVRDHYTIDAPHETLTRAALSPDNTSVAVQYAGGVTVYRAGAQRWRTAPISGNLAGPAAWTPDGTGVVALHGDGTLEALDARDGTPLRGRTLPSLPSAYVGSEAAAHMGREPARLVGWVSGAPVVAAAHDVLLLGATTTVLVTAPAAAGDDLRQLQVATAALSLPQVPAGSPRAGPLLARSWPLLRVGGPLALLLLVFAERLVLRRLGLLNRQRRTSGD